MIYCHKDGSKRILNPFKVINGEMKMLKQGRINIADYLVFQPLTTEAECWKPKIPLFKQLKWKHYSRSDIEKIILENVPNVEINEFRADSFGLITLKTVGERRCLVNPNEIHVKNNCFVVWKRTGLEFGCHDIMCEGELKQIHAFDSQIVNNNNNKINDIWYFRKARKVDNEEDYYKLCDELIDYMNSMYCRVKVLKSFIIKEYDDYDKDCNKVREITYKDPKSLASDFVNAVFDTKIIKKKKPLQFDCYNIWNRSEYRREVDNIAFEPKWYRQGICPKNIYNFYQGFNIEHKDCKDVNALPASHPFFNHILVRWCSNDVKVYNFVLDWFAHILQKPWEKMKTALVLRSTERAGKGIVVQSIAEIIGYKYFFQPSTPKQVLGEFNGGLRNNILLFIDEMVWGGDKERAGTLKKLTTEEYTYVNEKYMSLLRVRNLSNIIMASNEDWVVPAGATDTRWVVLDVSDELAIMKAGKRALLDSILDFDIKSLAKFLYERDISKFNIYDGINTDALRYQKIQTMSKLRKWWLDILNNGIIEHDMLAYEFGDDIEKDMLFKCYMTSNNDKHITKTKFWRDMERVLGINTIGNKKQHNGVRKRFIPLPTLDECRNQWCQLYNDDDWVFDDYE
jgi:hypothetical protein